MKLSEKKTQYRILLSEKTYNFTFWISGNTQYHFTVNLQQSQKHFDEVLKLTAVLSNQQIKTDKRLEKILLYL